MQSIFNKTALFVLLITSCFAVSFAQDQQELEAEREANAKLKGEHPLVGIAKTKPSSLRKELVGVHPRVFLTQSEIDALKEKARTHPELWQTAAGRVRALTTEPAAAPAQERRVQNEVGLGIAEAAFAYKITGEKKYLDAAKKYIDAGISYDTWGYTYNKPNVDLAAGHLLYGMGWGYDLLYNDLTPAERSRVREKLVKQAKLLHAFFKPKSGKTYAYSQNHTFIPISGLAIAAYALMDEVPEAKEWAADSRAIFDRVLATLGEDGYFYESMEYWIFSMPWIIHYMDAHERSTGEDLYKGLAGIENTHKFIAHITLPGGEFNFDYGDIYAGPITRARKGNDYERERINGKFRTNYNILYNLATRYGSGEAQGVADWVKSKGQVNAEEMWTFIWYNPKIKAVSINQQPTYHWFKDHGVVFWRSSWNDDATAWSFKAGPPEGHAATGKVKAFPDWRLSSGHAHPDAGSFIIWSNGRYLTGDSGYAGVPLTEHHNTMIFNGIGQAKEGKGHDAFAGVSYDRMNNIRLTNVDLAAGKVSITADLAPAYEPGVGVKKFSRVFEFSAPDTFLVKDSIEMERPSTITAFLHADNVITKTSDAIFTFEPGPTSLSVAIDTPKSFDTKIEKNILTAPGRPGSVDKGEREERGVRLATTTRQKVKTLEMKTTLRVEKGK
jgi:Heparinase II/III-like protein.